MNRAKDIAELVRDEIGDQLPDSLVESFREAWKEIRSKVEATIEEEFTFHGDERFEDGKAAGYDDGFEAGLDERHQGRTEAYLEVQARRAARVLDAAGLPYFGVRTDSTPDDDPCLVVELSEGDLEVMRRRLASI